MTFQPSLFDQPMVHRIENNEESQRTLNENKMVFTRHCKALFDYLWDGNSITSKQANKGFFQDGELIEISYLPIRAKDLRDIGVLISSRSVGRCKELYMSDEDREFNKQFT
jgi:hypothetical protein